tara:strand:+ start:278 stop:784 length:507 start_codon:yes stop_codon:yes gene_type:complete
MAIKTRAFLKEQNRDFNNILDTVGGPLNVKNYTTEATDLALTTADCGVVFIGTIGTTTGTSDGFNIDLPAPVKGAYFKLVMLNAALGNNSGAAITVTSTSDGDTAANLIVGQVVGGGDDEGANVVAAVDIITFVHNKATAGDFVELICDGTNWFALCQYDADGAITLA